MLRGHAELKHSHTLQHRLIANIASLYLLDCCSHECLGLFPCRDPFFYYFDLQ